MASTARPPGVSSWRRDDWWREQLEAERRVEFGVDLRCSVADGRVRRVAASVERLKDARCLEAQPSAYVSDARRGRLLQCQHLEQCGSHREVEAHAVPVLTDHQEDVIVS